MFSILMLCFREGLEAFLIVAIMAGVLRQAGRENLLPTLRLGVIVAVLMSVILGIALVKHGMSSVWEGWLALVAAILVVSCTLHMLNHGKHMKREITEKLNQLIEKLGVYSYLSLFLFVIFMVGREGVETATMIASLATQGSGSDLVIGGVIGVLCASAMALAWTKFGRRVNLSRFFQVSAVFMVVFSIQLVIYAFHEFSEAGALPLVDNSYWHMVSEPYGPDGQIGHWISYSLVLLPAAFMLGTWLKDRGELAIRTVAGKH
jgi:high-affinity iron transporter